MNYTSNPNNYELWVQFLFWICDVYDDGHFININVCFFKYVFCEDYASNVETKKKRKCSNGRNGSSKIFFEKGQQQ